MIAPDVTSDLVQFLSQAAARREAARDPDGAVTLLREAMTLSPSDLALKRRCAKLLGAAPLQAAELWRAIIAAAPGDAASWSELGVVESTLQRRGEAVRCFMRAVELAPADPALRSNLAVARLKADDPPGSEADSRIAIALDPRPEFLGNLGHALVALARFDEAFEVFTRALRLNPRLIDAMIGISRAYMGRGETEKAAAALHRALELDPENAFARSDLSVLLTHLGERGEFASPPPKVGRIGQGLNSNALLAMQYDPDCNKSAATRAALDWGFAQVATTPPVNFQQSRQEDPERRLRVGYVSADFYRHPVGWMGVGPILAHDRAEVEVFLYANNNSIDFITEDLQRGADGFARVRELDDDALAAQIVADRVDILVDLSGHTSGNRLAVFARRPAPVQISWLGYFATTGLSTVDYALFDDAHMVAGADALFSEQVLRLDHGKFSYRPPKIPEQVRAAPRPEGPLTFGSFNNFAKLNDEVIALWAALLRRAPDDSRLLLKWRGLNDCETQNRFRQRFERAGLSRDRLLFEGASEHEDMLQRYLGVDVALDPFPFCGGLTTCEALWMGTPVVTLPGDRPVSRQSLSILQAMGRREWAVASEEDYIRVALALADDAASRSQLRKSLPKEMLGSALCDHPRAARNLERIYRDAWRRWLRSPL